MKQIPRPLALLSGVVILGAVTPRVATAEVELVVVDVVAVADGYRASKLRGATVVNPKSEKIGELDDLIVGKDRVLFAIIQVGVFSASAAISSPCPTARYRSATGAGASCCRARRKSM